MLLFRYRVYYEVTETQYQSYTTRVSVNGGADNETLSTSGTITKDTSLAFKNNLEVPVPTGNRDDDIVIYCVWTGVVAAACLVLLNRKKKKSEKEI